MQTLAHAQIFPLTLPCFHAELERHQNVRGIRPLLHVSGPHADATGVLEQVHAGEAVRREAGGVSRLRLGLLQQGGLQVYLPSRMGTL